MSLDDIGFLIIGVGIIVVLMAVLFAGYIDEIQADLKTLLERNQDAK